MGHSNSAGPSCRSSLCLPWAASVGQAFCWSISFEEKVLIFQHWRWSPRLQSTACLGGTERSWPPSSARLARAAPLGLLGFRDTGTDLSEPSAPSISMPCAATSPLSWRHWFLLLQPTTHLESHGRLYFSRESHSAFLPCSVSSFGWQT